MEDQNALSSFDFELPDEQIAQVPPADRGASRLLTLDLASGALADRSFSDLPQILRYGDLLVVNDTKVLPAKVELRRGSGGTVRGLLLETPRPPDFRMMLQGRGRLAEGDVLGVFGGGQVRLQRAEGDGFWRVAVADAETAERLLLGGRMPLPPYIKRAAHEDPRDDLDRDRYQTVYAEKPGAVAAPTAGLHLTAELAMRLRDRGIHTATVTLHVGPGTFLPVRVDDLAKHVMLPEPYEVPEDTAREIALTRAAGGRVIAVGTTVVRALEGAVRAGPVFAGSGQTDLFIRPPFHFRVVDALITNFHLPRTTLLALVAAFCGRERLLAAYRHAVEDGYRFFSYGDAMLLADLSGSAPRTQA